MFISLLHLKTVRNNKGITEDEITYWNFSLTTPSEVQKQIDQVSVKATQVTVGTYVENLKEISLKGAYFRVVSSVLSTGLTLWRTGGVPTAYWEIFFYEKAASLGIPGALSCFFGVFLVKIPDTIVSAVVVAVFSILLPKQLKTKN